MINYNNNIINIIKYQDFCQLFTCFYNWLIYWCIIIGIGYYCYHLLLLVVSKRDLVSPAIIKLYNII